MKADLRDYLSLSIVSSVFLILTQTLTIAIIWTEMDTFLKDPLTGI